MELEIGRIYKVRDFSKDDLSKYSDPYGKLIITKINTTGGRGTIGFSKDFANRQLIHVGASQKYPSAPYLYSLTKIPRYRRYVYVPNELLEVTDNRIVDIRKMPKAAVSKVVSHLSHKSDRSITYNTHGRSGGGTIKPTCSKPEWYAKTASHLFFDNVTKRQVAVTMLIGTNLYNITRCPHCGYNSRHKIIISRLTKDLKYGCGSCGTTLKLDISDKTYGLKAVPAS